MLLLLYLLLIICAAPAAAQSIDNEGFVQNCGSLENAYGPYDYTNPTHVSEKLPIVERFHFNQKVESLTSGQSSDQPGADLDYTLRAFPNHHRALYSMTRYQLLHQAGVPPPEANYTAECYLNRALRFRPNDAQVYLIYGIYLSRKGEIESAINKYEAALRIDKSAVEAHYNLGLLYLKMGQVDLAYQHAGAAYDAGFPLQGLKNKLRKLGRWKENKEGN